MPTRPTLSRSRARSRWRRVPWPPGPRCGQGGTGPRRARCGPRRRSGRASRPVGGPVRTGPEVSRSTAQSPAAPGACAAPAGPAGPAAQSVATRARSGPSRRARRGTGALRTAGPVVRSARPRRPPGGRPCRGRRGTAAACSGAGSGLSCREAVVGARGDEDDARQVQQAVAGHVLRQEAPVGHPDGVDGTPRPKVLDERLQERHVVDPLAPGQDGARGRRSFHTCRNPSREGGRHTRPRGPRSARPLRAAVPSPVPPAAVQHEQQGRIGVRTGHGDEGAAHAFDDDRLRGEVGDHQARPAPSCDGAAPRRHGPRGGRAARSSPDDTGGGNRHRGSGQDLRRRRASPRAPRRRSRGPSTAPSSSCR